MPLETNRVTKSPSISINESINLTPMETAPETEVRRAELDNNNEFMFMNEVTHRTLMSNLDEMEYQVKSIDNDITDKITAPNSCFISESDIHINEKGDTTQNEPNKNEQKDVEDSENSEIVQVIRNIIGEMMAPIEETAIQACNTAIQACNSPVETASLFASMRNTMDPIVEVPEVPNIEASKILSELSIPTGKLSENVSVIGSTSKAETVLNKLENSVDYLVSRASSPGEVVSSVSLNSPISADFDISEESVWS